ncbi:HNH endonuclease [Methylobacterium sp. NPDC080182]|uniref:HNH endonuclease n=1 Tax=Methylobacterium sp. NPDC080182 TaxID=3390590 RepID=UPI003CFC92CD
MWKRKPSEIRIEGDVAYVALTRGFEAIIDVSDVPVVENYGWRVMMLRLGHAYAARCGDRPGSVVLMHRAILDAPQGAKVDHRDGDGLNNRRGNIRLATSAENNANMVVSRRNKLGIKGVSTEKSGRFSASIQKDSQKLYIGTFNTAEEASAAYFGAARILWGDFAKN